MSAIQAAGCSKTAWNYYDPISSHWQQLAQAMDAVATTTKLPKLRQWAMHAASELKSMAKRDRQREDEEDLRER